MRTVKMQGGLGNQLFCLAFAHSAMQLAGGPVAIDLSPYRSDRYGHVFELDTFARGLGLQPVERPLLGSRPATALARRLPVPGFAAEGAPPADPAALAALIERGRYFSGYWQNEAYIARSEAFADLVRAEVMRRAGSAPRRDVVIHYRTYREEIRPQARRGPGAAYVRQALAQVEAILGRPDEVCLISDDPAHASKALADLGRDLALQEGAGAWADLALLMCARAVILTNSSFSWWGGFCGEAEAVIYPRADGYIHYPIPAARFLCV